MKPASCVPETSCSTDQQKLWEQVKEEIKKQLGAQRYGIWFKQTELMKFDESLLVIGVPNVIIKQYLDQQYRTVVQIAAEKLVGGPIDVRLEVAPNLLCKARAQQKVGTEDGNGDVAPSLEGVREATRPRAEDHTFERLAVTAANQLPYLAAREIACNPHSLSRFLLVLGDHGLGKTALLQATHHAAVQSGVATCAECVTLESWCNDYYYSLETHKTRAFRQRYRGCDMLLLDDIQFLQGKMGAQDELLYTAKSILANGGRLVLSSTVRPEDLQEVKPALSTMLGGAFWVELAMPPPSECEQIARHLARAYGVKLSTEVVHHLSETYSNSIQELNGAVRSLAAYALLQGRDKVDFAGTKEALAATARFHRRPTTLSDIQQVLLDMFPISESELKGSSRCRNVCRARHLGMYLAKQLTGESLSDIGRFFGGRTHSTVKHAINQVEKHLEVDQGLASLLERSRRRLQWI